MKGQSAGYQEIDHTADWELEVWAPDLVSLIKQSAQGMYQLAGMRPKRGPRVHRSLVLPIFDFESLLVDFLSELLHYSEDEGLVFDSFELVLGDDMFHANLDGGLLAPDYKEIKAVTYHNLLIREIDRGLIVRIVFDV